MKQAKITIENIHDNKMVSNTTLFINDIDNVFDLKIENINNILCIRTTWDEAKELFGIHVFPHYDSPTVKPLAKPVPRPKRLPKAKPFQGRNK